MHRFFVPRESFAGDNITVTGEPAYQITRVLRLKPGDRIIVLDNNCCEFEIEIGAIKRDAIHGKIVSQKTGESEPGINLTLYQAILKTDKFEFVLQKGVEIGISNFVPFISERCIARKPSENKFERWQAIIREAAEQSRRSKLPILYPIISFKEACKQIDQPALIFWEQEKSKSLAKTLKNTLFNKAQTISVFIGPEGGFTHTEIEIARRHGIVPAGLGNRILRAETAGLVAISAIMYEKGELS